MLDLKILLLFTLLPPEAGAIRLFGSRLDNNACGGDIDLMVDFENPVESPAILSACLAVRASRTVFNRKVDFTLTLNS